MILGGCDKRSSDCFSRGIWRCFGVLGGRWKEGEIDVAGDNGLTIYYMERIIADEVDCISIESTSHI
jgi:hypothetical protein